jgi:hypothetical protein
MRAPRGSVTTSVLEGNRENVWRIPATASQHALSWAPAEGSTVPSNLTRDETRDRAELISVDSYHVELDLSGSDETFESITTVRFRSAWAGAATFLEPDHGASRPRRRRR